ncbi:MAG: carbamoyl-phosphate synthase small subunit [Legionellales bacterium]|nr:carbamoyl-phosphate synthase small subunit [Legionellales bacterium]
MLEPAILVLEDGSTFEGISIGVKGITFGEVVFNTAISGYQEILTDPSYAKQIITLTYPHIGNVGVNKEDEESDGVYAAGLIIRDLPLTVSNWRSEQSLQSYLEEKNVVAIAELDTRELTQVLRDKGALRGAIISDNSLTVDEAVEKLKALPSLAGQDLAKEVTTQDTYAWTNGVWGESSATPLNARVVVVDFGVKKSILRHLVARGFEVTVVPAKSSIEMVMALKPAGVLLSNGPGDPEPCDYAIELARGLLDKNIPCLGICLGFQILSLAIGATTEKMKFGHHGGNHPVQDIKSGRVLITSQNHGFCVLESSLPKTVEVTHRSLFDGTLQGWTHTEKPVMGFQGHPEAGPGPVDAYILFDQFVSLCAQSQEKELKEMSV